MNKTQRIFYNLIIIDDEMELNNVCCELYQAHINSYKKT